MEKDNDEPRELNRDEIKEARLRLASGNMYILLKRYEGAQCLADFVRIRDSSTRLIADIEEGLDNYER
jgi:hypothetical protein